MTELHAGLPPLTARIKALPVDRRGFPVPWFVAKVDGEWDFRCIKPGGREDAYTKELCWVCGQRLGANKAFVIGPMCAINRVTAEPPSHLECAEWSAKACPFLTKPRMRRNEKDMPTEGTIPGVGIMRNPGVSLIWITRSFKPFKTGNGNDFLFRVGNPERMLWFAEGRAATKERDHGFHR